MPTKTIRRGDNEEFTLVFNFDEISGDEIPAVGYDLTVWKEIRMSFRIGNDHYSFKATELTTENGGLIISGESNEKLIVKLTSEQTMKFNKPTSYYYDLKFIGSDGQAKTILTGEMKINLNVSN